MPVVCSTSLSRKSRTEPGSDSFDMAWLQMLLAETLERMKQWVAVPLRTNHIWRIFDMRCSGLALRAWNLRLRDISRRIRLRSPPRPRTSC